MENIFHFIREQKLDTSYSRNVQIKYYIEHNNITT